MTTQKEKAAAVLDTPTTAQETTHREFTPEQKRLATLTARAAMAGVTLYPIENDHGKTVYVASKWALCCELHDLNAVESWLNVVTGGGAKHASQ